MTAASIPEEAVSGGLAARLARMEPFTLFLSGFILLYGAVSLLLEHGAGIIGFAKAPYLNAASYLYALGFVRRASSSTRSRSASSCRIPTRSSFSWSASSPPSQAC